MGSNAMPVAMHIPVQGIDGLRIADASIMPTIIGGNVNAICRVIGERSGLAKLFREHLKKGKIIREKRVFVRKPENNKYHKSS